MKRSVALALNQPRTSTAMQWVFDNGVVLDLGQGVQAAFWMQDPNDAMAVTVSWDTGSSQGQIGPITISLG